MQASFNEDQKRALFLFSEAVAKLSAMFLIRGSQTDFNREQNP